MKDKKFLFKFISIIFLTFILAMGAYLAYSLYVVNSRKQLDEINQYINTNLSLLLQNRLGIMSFSDLNATEKSFDTARVTILEKINSTKREGLSYLENEKIKNNKLYPKYDNLINTNKALYQTQTSLLLDLNNFDSIVKNIYIYDPQIDFELDSLESNNEILIEKSTLAVNGIQEIIKQLEQNFGQNDKGKELLLLLEGYKKLFINLNNNLNSSNYSLIIENVDQIKQFDKKVKTQTFEVEKSLLYSPDMITLLTQETNLIFEYQYFLNN